MKNLLSSLNMNVLNKDVPMKDVLRCNGQRRGLWLSHSVRRRFLIYTLGDAGFSAIAI